MIEPMNMVHHGYIDTPYHDGLKDASRCIIATEETLNEAVKKLALPNSMTTTLMSGIDLKERNIILLYHSRINSVTRFGIKEISFIAPGFHVHVVEFSNPIREALSIKKGQILVLSLPKSVGIEMVVNNSCLDIQEEPELAEFDLEKAETKLQDAGGYENSAALFEYAEYYREFTEKAEEVYEKTARHLLRQKF